MIIEFGESGVSEQGERPHLVSSQCVTKFRSSFYSRIRCRRRSLYITPYANAGSPSQRVSTPRMSTSNLLRVGLSLALLIVVASTAPAQSRTPAEIERTFVGAAAWQVDEELGKTWQQGLADFPDQNHEPLSKEFSDLTAAFAYGRMVPDDASRLQSVRAFLAAFAPSDTAGISDESVDLLPQVGQKAPDFHIADTDGVQHSLSSYMRDQRALILVFSRAHW